MTYASLAYKYALMTTLQTVVELPEFLRRAKAIMLMPNGSAS